MRLWSVCVFRSFSPRVRSRCPFPAKLTVLQWHAPCAFTSESRLGGEHEASELGASWRILALLLKCSPTTRSGGELLSPKKLAMLELSRSRQPRRRSGWATQSSGGEGAIRCQRAVGSTTQGSAAAPEQAFLCLSRVDREQKVGDAPLERGSIVLPVVKTELRTGSGTRASLQRTASAQTRTEERLVLTLNGLRDQPSDQPAEGLVSSSPHSPQLLRHSRHVCGVNAVRLELLLVLELAVQSCVHQRISSSLAHRPKSNTYRCRTLQPAR